MAEIKATAQKQAKPLTPYHHGDLKEALIHHALQIIEAEGISRLTLRKTARLAGVSHAAPAHHFKDMKGLLAAIAQKGFAQLKQTVGAALQKIPPEALQEKLKQVGLSYINFALAHPAYFKVMYHPELSEKNNFPELHRQSQATFSLLQDLLKECQEKGVVAPGDIGAFSLFMWSSVHGFAVLAMDQQLNTKGLENPPEDYAQKLVPLIFSGLHP